MDELQSYLFRSTFDTRMKQMDKKPIALLVLAAGMGSRFGGLKQMAELGPNGESIIDYSVHDAIELGFDQIVFVVRESFLEAFKKRMEPLCAGRIETCYVTQELDDIPAGYSVPEDRVKPWGTAHAVWATRDVIRGPFAVLNGDDFYGRKGLHEVARYLRSHTSQDEGKAVLIGYRLDKTLSDSGTVNRGVCTIDTDGKLLDIVEHMDISRHADGRIIGHVEGEPVELVDTTAVSMNLWGLSRPIIDYVAERLGQFMEDHGTELKSELYLPQIISELLQQDRISIDVVDTDSEWFGVTYPQDADTVRDGIMGLIGRGDYPHELV